MSMDEEYELGGAFNAALDWLRARVYNQEDFAAWLAIDAEPAWRADERAQMDGWSPDLADRADAWACDQDDAEYEALMHAEYQTYMQSEQQQYYDSLGREDLWRQWGPWR